jgi:hypothetical protein
VDRLAKDKKNIVRITSNDAVCEGWTEGVAGPGVIGMPSKMWKGAAASKANSGSLRCQDGRGE